MKKLALVVLSLFVLPFFVKGQQGSIKISGALFPQVSFLFNNDDSNAGPELDYAKTIRFGGGIGATYGLSDYFDIGAEFLISPEGQKYTGVYEKGGVKKTLEAYTKLTYLKVPLMLFLHNDLEQVSFNFLVGPQFSFLIGGQETAKFYENGSLKGEFSSDFKTITISGDSKVTGTYTESPYSKFLPGVFLGLGMSFPVGDNMFISTILRFDYAFGDAENKNSKVKTEFFGQTVTEEAWATQPKYDLKDSTPQNFKAHTPFPLPN